MTSQEISNARLISQKIVAPDSKNVKEVMHT
jgi:hypothetical protein